MHHQGQQPMNGKLVSHHQELESWVFMMGISLTKYICSTPPTNWWICADLWKQGLKGVIRYKNELEIQSIQSELPYSVL